MSLPKGLSHVFLTKGRGEEVSVAFKCPLRLYVHMHLRVDPHSSVVGRIWRRGGGGGRGGGTLHWRCGLRRIICSIVGMTFRPGTDKKLLVVFCIFYLRFIVITTHVSHVHTIQIDAALHPFVVHLPVRRIRTIVSGPYKSLLERRRGGGGVRGPRCIMFRMAVEDHEVLFGRCRATE